METEKESHFQETFMAQFENDLGVQTLQNFGAVFAPTMSAGAVKVRIEVSLVFGSLVASPQLIDMPTVTSVSD